MAGTASSRRRGGLLAAALVGGLIGGGLVFGAERFLVPPRADAALAGRVETLEKRFAALPAGAAPSTIEPRLAALEASVKQAGEDARAARATAEAAARQAAEALARPAVAGGTAPGAGGASPGAGGTAPGAGGAAPTPVSDPAMRDAVAALTTRLDESTRQGRSNAAAITEIGQKVDALGTRTTDGFAAATGAVQALQGSLRDLQGDAQVLKTRAGALDARSAEAETRLAAVASDLGRVSADVAKLSPAASQAGLRTVVSGRLDEALRTGAPLGPVLSILNRLGADPAALAALQPFAEAPAPSAASLAAEFKPLAERMTAVPRGPSDSWTEKVWRVFGGIVTVRAVGDGSGTDLPGLVGTIETALARGTLPAAAAAWDRLPASAKAVSAEWAGRLKGRIAADEAARSISAAALAALDGAR